MVSSFQNPSAHTEYPIIDNHQIVCWGEKIMNFCFNAVIIDTSALENYQFDYCGWTTKTLPSFFSYLKEQKIKVLNHPVLDGEVKKHIAHCTLIERVKGLQQSFQRNKDFYKLIGISSESAIK